VTESPHFEVVEVFTRPHPLDPATLKAPIDAAGNAGPGGHVRISAATRDELRRIEAEREQAEGFRYRPPWDLGTVAFGRPVVVDEDVPDEEWRVAVWRIGP
jgi:hypothetical protein